MPKLLSLLKAGDRISPTVYQFSPNTILCVHRDGNEYCQHLVSKPATTKLNHQAIKKVALDSLGAVGLMILLALASAAVSITSGCASGVGHQLDTDMATSALYPRINMQDDVSAQKLAEFRKQNAHANRVLASARGQAVKAGGDL